MLVGKREESQKGGLQLVADLLGILPSKVKGSLPNVSSVGLFRNHRVQVLAQEPALSDDPN